jgi:Holliday junction DNA helicase RuvA
VRVWTHLVVRDDAHLLYGFPDPRMREVFRLLLQVRGVGPGLAQAILSTLPGDELLAAITAGDAGALTRIKGVGKKTAEQILLDLRDRAPHAEVGEGGERGVVVPAGNARSRAMADAVAALVSIGYSDKQARKSVDRAAERVEPGDLELLVRTALQE